MDKSKNLRGHLFALTANVMWGLMSPIGKSALQEFSAISVTTFRMVGAAAAFWLLSIFCKQEHVNHQDMLKIFFASLFALVFNQGVFIFGLSMTSPIDASINTKFGQGAEFEICDPGLGVWVNDVNIIWNEKEAGQWEMRPNALLLCLFGTNCNIFLIATFRFIGNSHF